MAVVPPVAALVLITGIGLVSVVGNRGDDASWARWSSVGESFGLVNSVVSAIAVAALVVTWAWQSRDLREQRAELARQRETWDRVETALRRSAEVDMRTLHVDLIRMAIDDPHLADVWPNPAGPDDRTRTQYLYANLMLQHTWLLSRSGVSSSAELESNLRYLFSSPIVRAFWRATEDGRRSIYVDGSPEMDLAARADRIYQEYESVVSRSTGAGRAAMEDPSRPPAGYPG